jgi:hypothetical protein
VPLNFTVLEPWLAPNPAPLTVTVAPVPPFVGDKLVIPGPEVTVNVELLLGPLFTVTTMGPVVAPAGTGTLINPDAQLVGVADTPLNVTELAPWLEPKFDPFTLTTRPTGPDAGDKLLMAGAAVTVKPFPALAWPKTVTMMLPVVAPLGTFTPIEFALQKNGVAIVPLNLTVLEPCVSRKLDPEIVIAVPIEPEFCERLLILGTGSRVNPVALLATPPTVTTTFPVVAPEGTGTVMDVVLHADGTPVVPLNVTVLVPCGDPNPVPVIVTDVPTMPFVGERLEIAGPAWTVKFMPADAFPLTVTTTFPVVAPTGGFVTICV